MKLNLAGQILFDFEVQASQEMFGNANPLFLQTSNKILLALNLLTNTNHFLSKAMLIDLSLFELFSYFLDQKYLLQFKQVRKIIRIILIIFCMHFAYYFFRSIINYAFFSV